MAFGVGDSPQSVRLADLNGDQIVDLMTANQSSDNVTVRLGIGDGRFENRVDFSAGDRPTSITLADLDEDGDMDFVVHFRMRETGITCGDTEVFVSGTTSSGDRIVGSDTIVPKGCK